MPDRSPRTRSRKLLFGLLRSAARFTFTSSRAFTNRDPPTDASQQTRPPGTGWEFLAQTLDDDDRTQRLNSVISTIGACVARIAVAVAVALFALGGIVYVIQIRPDRWGYVVAAMPTVIAITLAIRRKNVSGSARNHRRSEESRSKSE
jgi:hypothetical protein